VLSQGSHSRLRQRRYPPKSMLSRARNLGVFAAYAERRYAKSASQQLLELFRREQREHPDLEGRALYGAVIARRLGSNSILGAADILRRAEESFAVWPRDRKLTFRDVVHYQIFDEYMRQRELRVGTRTDFGVAVARVIPDGL
jgi:hypothetical protein